MTLQGRIERWLEAKVIDRETADRILRFEDEQPSASWVLYGISGLGVVVMLTGLISIIAANWDDISSTTKLVGYFFSLTVLGWLVVRRSGIPGVVRECLITAFGLYVLAGIGLVGQIYNLESDGYSAIFFWLTIILPIALLAENRLLSNLWFLGLALALSIWTFDFRGIDGFIDRTFISLGIPYFILGVGYGLGHLFPEKFARAGRLWSYAAILLFFAAIGNIAWATGNLHAHRIDLGSWPLVSWTGVACALLGVALRKIQPSKILTYAVCTTVASSALLILPPLIGEIGKHEIFGCALFIVAWSGAAAVAAAIHRRRLFDFSAMVIGIRFIVVYFEVFGSLAATGIGLILSGGVILGIAYMWHRYRGTVARAIQERV